jgi:hypothetical protein
MLQDFDRYIRNQLGEQVNSVNEEFNLCKTIFEVFQKVNQDAQTNKTKLIAEVDKF